MTTMFRPALITFLILTGVTGVLYPLFITIVGHLVFRHQANGSLLIQDGRIIGSELIGQQFTEDRFFWGRPSATSPPYNGASSSGSNLGPTNPELFKVVNERVEALRCAHPDQSGPVPIDLVTASASGLDPHISPAAAEYQVARVAKSRGLGVNDVRNLIQRYTEGRTAGFLGEPRVNVLRLNLGLEEIRH